MNKNYVTCGHNIGIDCKLLEEQFNTSIEARIKLRNLALFHNSKLGKINGGIRLAHLTETYLKQKMPVEKSIGQNASYMSVDLPEELIISAVADAYCSRKVTEDIQKHLKKSNSCLNEEKTTSVLKEGTQMIIHFRRNPVARGDIVFNRTFGGNLK